jgi:hypothetical protein
MTTNYTELKTFAWMSQASYLDFTDLNQSSSILAQKNILQNSTLGTDKRFATKQADVFTDATKGFSFQNYIPNDSEGFSATVFKSNENGEFTIAVRGTHPTSPIDLLIADGLGVVLAGKALGQAISPVGRNQYCAECLNSSVQ